MALDLGGDDDDTRMIGRGIVLDLLRMLIARRRRGLIDIADIEHRLAGQQLQFVEGLFFFRVALDKAGRLTVAKDRKGAVDQLQRLLGLLVIALGLLLKVGAPLFETLEVRQHQLGLDHLGIGERIDLVGDVNDIAVFKAAQHIGDGIGLADIGEELVAQPFALRCAFHQARNIHKAHARRQNVRRLADGRQLFQPRIGHRHLAHIGLDGAEREVGRLRGGGAGECIEKCRLADIRQADNAHLEAHGYLREIVALQLGGIAADVNVLAPAQSKPAWLPGTTHLSLAPDGGACQKPADV